MKDFNPELTVKFGEDTKEKLTVLEMHTQKNCYF